jgi:gamma-glutamyltranspeptidase/glutathione hydrolase
MATDEQTGDLYASFGVMGGFMQPQGHMQVFVALVDDELDPQAALDRPRFCLDVEFTGKKVALEEGIPEKIMNGLDEMGHPVEMFHGLERDRFGRGQIILRDPSSGVLTAGSDPRGDGCAMCLF